MITLRQVADPLRPLLELPGVAAASEEARRAVDALLGHRVLRRTSGPVSAESVLRGAWASAALSGSVHDLAAVRAGAVEDPVLAGALRLGGELGELADTWPRAPRQVLARMHLLAAADLAPPDELGRPTRPESGDRLDGLVDLIAGGTAAPAVIVAAVVHGELLTLAPFGSADGVIARAAARLTLIQRGLDPKSVSVPEVGHRELSGEYDEASASYSKGGPAGVSQWLRHCCAAVVLGAREGTAICEAVLRG